MPDTTTYPGTDYYEIAVVQYRMKFHRDLPATLLRGYVQLSTGVVPGKQVALSNANVDPARRRHPDRRATPASTLRTTSGRRSSPRRTGRCGSCSATCCRPGVDGDLFLPVDTSLMGSGMGPNMMQLDANGVPMDMAPTTAPSSTACATRCAARRPSRRTCYSENRATLHLHGGITPWISDGTPHQWITPGRRGHRLPEGVSVSNVPDMPDPGPGAQTFFYTNQQSARLMFYHDHAWGITRLNVYAGEAAGYLLTDPMEQSLIAPTGALAGLGVGTPLVVQDKTFVPSEASHATDPTWESAQVGRRRQPVDAARLHAGTEPGRSLRDERVRALDVRPVVLAAGEGREVPADRQPLLRPRL